MSPRTTSDQKSLPPLIFFVSSHLSLALFANPGDAESISPGKASISQNVPDLI